FKIKQIAGFVARRIVNHMNPHLDVCQGEKLGFIKFGSRVDLFLPLGTKLDIKLNQKVRGGETVIAKL
ncbi:MAG TPA: phosphatidylserine decarboxylase family protein, partial [Flavobacteriaceae bacterium]|nr:phosphatidylserine decarboxylase family protein [Flavobacteriaceae bacterium]